MQHPKYCKNCGSVLNGHYCAQCGQQAKEPIVSLREFTTNAMGDLFSADSRIWRTLFPLLFRPGKLTMEYLAGRRENYTSPFRIYLILSLLFFLLTSLFDTALDVTIEDRPLSLDTQTTVTENSDSGEQDEFSCQQITIQNSGFVNKNDLENRLRQACEKIKIDSGNSLFRALADNIPMMMFFFIPLVAILMKLLYLFSGRKYVEHLLFLLHYHAAFFLMLTLMMIVSAFANIFPSVGLLSSIASAISWFYIPAYLLVALRRVYSQSWLATNIKYVLLLVGYSATLAIALATTTVYTTLTL